MSGGDITEEVDIKLDPAEMALGSEVSSDSIYVGRSFGSFDELERFISKFEQDNKQKFWIRSSRSVEAARKILKRPLSENIRYYELQYSCIHGGLEFKTRGKGIRNMSTHKMNCPAKIKLRASPDGNRLEVRSFVSTHEGHSMSEDVFHQLPQNRRKLRGRKIRSFLTVDYAEGKKRKVPKHLMDPPFISSSNNDEMEDEWMKDQSQDEINKSLLLLRDEYGANTTVLYDDENNFKALYFYTNDMKKSLFAWPEVVYMYGIHNWLSRHYVVILLVIRDSNGMNEIVGVGILNDEDKDALLWFLQTFRGVFRADDPLPIKCIFSYKSLVENELAAVFPEVPRRVSIYYAMKTFGKVINADNFIISNRVREVCHKMFVKMLHFKTFDEYKVVYSLFCKVAPTFLLDYYNREWEVTKELWAVHNLPPLSLVDANRTNKEVALDNQLKNVIPKDSSILTFIRQLLKWLDALKAGMQYKASVHILKKPVVHPEQGSWQEKYSNYLTHYAYSFVVQQMNLSSEVKLLGETDDGSFVVQEETNCYSLNSDNCLCVDASSMGLPCRHMFSLREYLGLPLFQESLCNHRWTKEYYLDHRLDSSGVEKLSEDTVRESSPTNSETDLTERAVNVTNQLLNVVFLDGKLEKRVKTLENIFQAWSSGYDVKITKERDGLQLEEQEVIEEVCELYEHDPESVEVFEEVMESVEETATVQKPTAPSGEKTTIVVAPNQPDVPKKASVHVKFEVSKYNKQMNPLKFSQKKEEDKIKMILSWISKSPVLMKEALNGNYVLTAVDIELQPENIQHSILHESVDLNILTKYLEPVALKELKAVVQHKRIHEVWQCFICELLLDDDCVLCCSCLLWFHPKCVGLPSPQKRKLWFCYNCHEKHAAGK